MRYGKEYSGEDAELMKSGAAFTLLEVVVSLLVVGVVAALLAPLWVAGIQGSVESGKRVAAVASLREEVEEWTRQVETNYRGESFDDLATDLAASYSAGGAISLAGVQWVEWVDSGGGTYVEQAVAAPGDYLRVVWQHEAGARIWTQFARKEVE